uniref:Uncharacterized protein n=1 Tax=Timema monikensis TaxID=170555 RepID=A0A7R9E6N0_9NEOP|nr:unnamed protein product [Timema monikensis]
MNLRLLHRALTDGVELVIKRVYGEKMYAPNRPSHWPEADHDDDDDDDDGEKELQVDEDLCRNPPTEVSHNQPVLTSHHPSSYKLMKIFVATLQLQVNYYP